jgi:hypothetical protein
LNKGDAILGTNLLSAASDHRAGSQAKLTLEEAGEMRLVGETGAQGDVGQRRVRRVEQAARALEAKREQVLMWCTPGSLTESTGEVRGGETDFARQRFYRQARIELCVHQLERAALGDRG